MDLNRMTEKVRQGLMSAQSLAARESNQQVEVEHLLLALLGHNGGLAVSILAKAGVELEGLTRRIK